MWIVATDGSMYNSDHIHRIVAVEEDSGGTSGSRIALRAVRGENQYNALARLSMTDDGKDRIVEYMAYIQNAFAGDESVCDLREVPTTA